MVNRILTFIIGILVGAIIVTGILCICQKSNIHNDFRSIQNESSISGPRGDMNGRPQGNNNKENMNVPQENDNKNSVNSMPEKPNDNQNNTKVSQEAQQNS